MVKRPSLPVVARSARLASHKVGRVALGTASWSLGEPPLTTSAARRVIKSAVSVGVTVIDTAAAYTTRDDPSYGERLIGAALREDSLRDQTIVATKGGHFRVGDRLVIDARPDTVRRNCEASLRALAVDQIDLYFLHKPDPDVPLAESVGVLGELQSEGKIDLVGVSNVSAEQAEEALTAAEVAAVQNPARLFVRDPVLDLCEAGGLLYFGYAPFADYRCADSLSTSAVVSACARRWRVSVHQILLAMLLCSSPVMVVVTGSRRPATIKDSAAAMSLDLAPRDWEKIDLELERIALALAAC